MIFFNNYFFKQDPREWDSYLMNEKMDNDETRVKHFLYYNLDEDLGKKKLQKVI